MHITTICPPSPFLLDERVFMSLGILKVAASLEQEGHQVAHLDLSGVLNYVEQVRQYCQRIKDNGFPSIQTFAITATTPQMPMALKINQMIKEEIPNAKTILGGPHPTLLNAASRASRTTPMEAGRCRASRAMSLLQSTFSTIVCGDGERAIHHALSLQGRGEIVDADDPKSDLWLTSDGFTASPWPARHLVDVGSYRYEIDGERALHQIFQLGCPFACGFCGGRNSPMLRRIRLRTTESAIAEMEHLYLTYGVKAMMLNDDELNVNRQMIQLMMAIGDLGKKHDFTWKLRGFVKAELFTEEQAQAMYEAGFRWLLCGFESAHPRILKNINKKATLDDNTRMLRIAHKYGLKVKALMSIGHPGECEETVLATRDWLLEEKPDDFDVTIITQYPGTPYWDQSLPLSPYETSGGVYAYEINGDKLYSQDIDFTKEMAYYKGVPGDYTSYVWTDFLTAQQLVKLRDDVESEVRGKLGIPYPSLPQQRYEKSMGSHL